MIFTRKAFENELNRRMHEEYVQRMRDEKVDSLQKRICILEEQMFNLRMKADPEFRRRNTPTCGCDMEAK